MYQVFRLWMSLLSGRYVEFPIYPFRCNEYVSMMHQVEDRQSYLEYLDEIQYPIYEGVKHVQAWLLNELL